MKAPGRELLWVNACEIDHYRGCLTIRAGSIAGPPLLVALPALAVPDLPSALHSASLLAEKQYWDVVGPLVGPRKEDLDPASVDARVGSWVVSQDWDSAADRAQASGSGMFIVTHVGFVGFHVSEPFASRDVLAIFDPLQLRRLRSTIDDAVGAATRAGPSSWNEAIVAQVLQVLAERPWADLVRDDPSPEDARLEMRRRRGEFLARDQSR